MKRQIQIIMISVSLFSAFNAFSAAKASLNFVKQVELPNLGLSIKMMSDARETPLAPPTVYTYTYTQDKTSWKEDMYEPWALWYAGQHGGRWIDKYTNSLTVARITCPFVNNMKSKHITRARYQSIIDAVFAEPIEWTDENVKDWVLNFTQARSVKSEKLTPSTIKIKNLTRFYLDDDPSKLAYAFQLNPAAAGQSKVDASYYFFIIILNKTIDANSANRMVNGDFIKCISASSSRGDDTINPSDKFQAKQNTSILARRNAPEKSAEFVESRNQVANSIKNMKEWWYVNTDNYILLSDLTVSHKIMVKEIQEDIEYLREAYAALIPPRTDIMAVSVIRIFASPQEYLAYVGPEHQWSGGLWMASKKEMLIRPVDWGNNKDQRARAKSIVYHEAFHQYLYYALDQLETSVWFNEGHAEFFEDAEIRNNKLEINENEYKTQELLKMIAGNRADVYKLVNMDYPDFYSKNDQQRTENYMLAWALVYYLRKGASLDRPASHADLLDRYVDALCSTRNPAKATETAFSQTNQFNFQKDFIAFWTSKNKRSAARRNQIFEKFNSSRR